MRNDFRGAQNRIYQRFRSPKAFSRAFFMPFFAACALIIPVLSLVFCN